jgi:pyruvate dehydrogenase E1 component alpha subunit
MDVMEVHRATTKALAALRAGGGPMFIEFQTYRFRAHSMFDPDLYRDPAEVEQWKQRDPITTFAARLVTDGVIDDSEIDAMWTAARDETEAAVAAADAAPIDTLLDHVTRPVVPEDPGSGNHDTPNQGSAELVVPADPGSGDHDDDDDEVWP